MENPNPANKRGRNQRSPVSPSGVSPPNKKANGAKSTKTLTQNQTQSQTGKSVPKPPTTYNEGTVEVLLAFGPRPVSTLDAQTNIKIPT